jgi:hypothetical protein
MDPTPPSMWTRPWRGAGKALGWLALVAGGAFAVTFCIGLFTAQNATAAQVAPFALVVSLVLTSLAAGWFACRLVLSDWRHFGRAVFAVACLITLMALALAEENWRGKHDWQKYRREWEAKGEQFDMAALAPAPVPDEKNFALTPLLEPLYEFTRGPSGKVWRDTNALAYLERISPYLSSGRGHASSPELGNLEKGTFMDLKAWAGFYQGNTNYAQAKAEARPAEQVLVAMGQFDADLKELREAAVSRPACRFPIHYDEDPPWGILLPHLAKIKSLTMVTEVRATAELEAGRPAEAFDDLKLGLRLSDCVRNEVFLIDYLVRIATLAIDLQTVREGLVRHAWTEAQLTELETNLSGLNMLAEYKSAMRGERAGMVTGLDYIRRDGFRAQPMDFGDGNGGNSSIPSPGLMPSGWLYQNMLTMSRWYQQFPLATVDEKTHCVFPGTAESGAKAFEGMRAVPYSAFAKLLLPAVDKATAKSARMQAYVDLARVACALERYRLANGRLPDTLDVLGPRFIAAVPNDVIGGKPLRYRPDSKGGYILYSIGWNQTDDGGDIGWSSEKNHKSVDATKGDWVWKMTE